MNIMGRTNPVSGWRAACLMLVSLLLSGCGKQIPSDIIQPADMQSLLYDYHLAKSLAADLPYNESYKLDAYYDYVFEKHHVTEAEFDSSMVWYARHNDFLGDIYKELNTRLEGEEERMRNQIKMREGEIAVSFSGDTVDVWQERSLFWLTSSELLNKVTFSLKADTSFHHNDVMELKADFRFFPEKLKTNVVMGLSYTYHNDTITGATAVVSTTGEHSLRFKTDSALNVRHINGYMYYEGDTANGASVLVNNIRLMRYHEKK